MKRILTTLALVAGLGLCATPAMAGLSYNLADFIQTPQTINGPVVAPLTFTGSGLPIAPPTFNAAAITVTGVADLPSIFGHGPVGPGLYYTGDFGVTGANQTLDVSFTYIVTSTSANIEDASVLVAAGGVQNGGQIRITEQVQDIHGTFLASPMIIMNPTMNQVYDQKFFSMTDYVVVTKDISLSTGSDPNGSADFSVMYQNFSIAPEPATVMSAIVGLPLLGLWLRRRSK